MRLLEDIIGTVRNRDAKVEEVVISPYWTAICSVSCGIACTIGANLSSGMSEAGTLRGRKVADLFELAFSWDFLEASIGVAALNSVIAHECKSAAFAPHMIPRARGKKIAVVGRFPFVERLREIAGELWVIEKEPHKGDFPDTAAEEFLPKCEVAIITGSTIINKSLERLLDLSENAYTIVMGPSTPLSPVLFQYGANLVAGVRVKDCEQVLKEIAEGRKVISDCPGIEQVVLEAA